MFVRGDTEFNKRQREGQHHKDNSEEEKWPEGRYTQAYIKILFVSPYPTNPEKRPYSNNFISIFSQELFFFNFIATEKIVQCKQCYLSRLFVYLILLPIVGNFISIFSQEYIFF